MVKLSSGSFVDATAQMCRASGVKKTRISVKFRPGVGTIYLKSTDHKTTLTTKLKDVAELKLLENLLFQYAVACTKRAPLERANSGSAKKKGKKK